jgi:hypothetical protein
MGDDQRKKSHDFEPFNLSKEQGRGSCHSGTDTQISELWCCQIVFQMQRLLETNCNTDPGSPWSIRFTWEPNFWTKQLASLGESGPILWALSYLLRINKGNLLSLLHRSVYTQEKVFPETVSGHGVIQKTGMGRLNKQWQYKTL